MRSDTGIKPIIAAIIRLYNTEFKDQKYVYYQAPKRLTFFSTDRSPCLHASHELSNRSSMVCEFFCTISQLDPMHVYLEVGIIVLA